MIERAKKRKKVRIIVLSLVVFIILFSIISMIFTKNIYDDQFQRNDKPEYSGYLRYSDVEEYDSTIVEFDSGENTLKGYLYGAENKKGLVVIAHGLGGGAERYLPEALYFVDKGWSAFAYDCTGSYDSEGESTVGLAQSVIDLDAALTYINSNNSISDFPIMLYGHSWGGYAVTAILNYNYNITAVTSIAGFNSPIDMLMEQAKRMSVVLGYIEYPFGWAYQTLLFGKTARLTAVDGINSSNTPVMIIHGDGDEEILYDGASIIACKDEITNPNVVYKTCSTENHNGHNSLFVSEAASVYNSAKNVEYKAIYDSYDGNIPNDVKAEYYEGVDKYQSSERDISFLNEINQFFENSLSN